MELEHFCDRSKQLQPESGADPRFRTARDEELDPRDLIHISGEDGKNSRCRFFAFALVKSVNDNEGPDRDGFERADDKFLQLGAKGFLCDLGIGAQDWK